MAANALLLAFGAAVLLSLDGAVSEKPPNYSFVMEATEHSDVSYHDYIIIGGGTAGCPLGATLSKSFEVLVLERGGSPYGNMNVTRVENFGNNLADQGANSAAQKFVSEDGVFNARAKVLGGGSCVNAGFYSRASTDYVRDAGWDSKLANDSYHWVEDVVAFRPPVKMWQSAFRSGLISAGVTPDNGFTYDHIEGTKTGGTIFDTEGNRHTAADLLQYSNRKRIKVLLHATVQRILFRTSPKKAPRAYGVLYRDSNGKMHRAYLNIVRGNDIIVSAGALGSPQILMLSGIGPSQHLVSKGINPILDFPDIGQGMADNPMNGIYVPSPLPVEVSLIQVVGITASGTYIEASSGNVAAPPHVPHSFGLFSPSIGQLSSVPPKLRTEEVMKRAVKAERSMPPDAYRGGFILEKVIGPLSSGDLKLNTTNPDDNPLVRFNYFQHPADLQRCVLGMQMIERVVESNPFSEFKYKDSTPQYLENITALLPGNELPRHNNDSSSLEQFCRDTVLTIWHYHGGCQMGRVVDSSYRVMGVDALRVIDGSTLLSSPGTNPQATIMMLGRYMGIKILEERGINDMSEG